MYDFVVLGGGSAGYAAARTAISLGMRTAVIDGAPELGGLCILRGCMPSKAVIESANRMLTLRRASEFGLRCHGIEAKPAEIIQRKRGLVDEFASYRRGQLESGVFDLIRGRGVYENPHRIRVQRLDGDEQIVECASSLIATGSVVSLPAVPGLKEAKPWTSDEVLEAEQFPKSIVVLGGGAIALEMAHYLAAMGVEVTVLQRSATLLSTIGGGAGEVVRHSLEQRGIRVECGTGLLRVETGTRRRVIYEVNGEERFVEAEQILAALGRSPATEHLGLEAAGVTRRGRTVVTGLNQETSARGIFAAGDVCGPLEVVHLAIEQGELAAWNAARFVGKVTAPERVMDYRLKLFGVFCEPQVAVAGLSEREMAQSGRRIGSADYPFNDHGKSMVQGETEGFVKLWADLDTGELLAGLVVGPEAVELIHEVVIALRFRCTVGEFAKIPHYHPSLSEIWTYPAEELSERVGKE